MLYAKIKNNKVEKIIDRPNWFMDNGQPVSDEYLKNQNIYPINIVEDSEKNNMYHNISVNDMNDMVVDVEKKEVNNYYKYTPVNKEVLLQKIYEGKRMDVDRNRDASIFRNFEYDFPNGKGVVQLRNDIDMRNIQVNTNEAMVDLINNEPNKIHIFMDADNVLHEMTAKQMTELGTFSKTRAQQFYNVSWNHKHNNLKNIYDDVSKSIQQKIDEILAYDTSVGFQLNLEGDE